MPQAGFTFIEMLVTLAILSIVLGIVSSFLISSMRLTEQTEARNEMQVNLRAAMEMVSTDLYSAGSEGVAFECAFNWVVTPAVASTRPAARDHSLTVRYCDPYTGAANTVSYSVDPDPGNDNLLTLFRNNVAAIPGVLAFELEFTCAPTPCENNPTAAGFNPDLVRSVTVKLTAQSTRRAQGANSTCTFDGGSCTSKPGFYYEYAEQAVSLPNLGN